MNASGGPDRDAAGGFGGGGRGFGGGGRGGGGRGGRGNRGAAGFGVRVIHSGVWGFASSPIVSEYEIKRITGIAAEVAKASAVAKKVDVKLAPVPAYTEYWATPLKKEPGSISTEDKQAFVQKVVDTAVKVKGVSSVTANVGITNEWKYFASSRRLLHRTGNVRDHAVVQRLARKIGDVTKTRNFVGVPKTGGWEVAEESEMLENAERIANEAVEMTTREAGRHGAQGSRADAVARDADHSRDRRARDRARSHPRLRGELRRHELREAVRRRQAEIRLEADEHHRRPHRCRAAWRPSASTTTA